MKALCAGALMEPPGGPGLQGPPNLANDRHLTGAEGGMDFVDSASSSSAAAPANPGTNHPHHHRKPPRLTSPQREGVSNNSNNNNYNSSNSEMDVDSVTSRQVANELTLLKSPDSAALHQERVMLLQRLSALNDTKPLGSIRKGEERDYPGPWPADTKPDTSLDNQPRPPSSSPTPHIHPVKRALKRFGNEQSRLSQQQAAGGNKPDPDKGH